MKLNSSHLLTLAMLSGVSLSAAADVRIKVATILPKGTSQYYIIQELAEDWRKASSGRVELKIAPGGQKDGEAGIVKKLNSRNYQAGLLSATGLSEIEPDVTALQMMPLVFHSWEEMDYVRERVRDDLEDKLRAKGFVTLLWADAGWVNYFSKVRATTPEQFKSLEMFSWAGNSKQTAIMKSFGYRPVELETDAIHSSFASSLIECAPLPPVFASGLQIQREAPYVVDVKWAPIIGAMIIRQDVWADIPAELHEKLLALSRKSGVKLRSEGRRFHDETLAAWRKRPEIHVHTPTLEEQALWDQLGRDLGPSVRDNLVPAPMYDKVMQLLNDFRATASTH